MLKLLKHAGHFYRLAQEDEPVTKVEDVSQPNVLAATNFLETHGIKNIEFSNYYGGPEGFQVAFNTTGWGNAEAIIVLDFAAGKTPKLQSMTVTFCGNSLAASGAVELQELIRALATLSKLQIKAGPIPFAELEQIEEHEQRKETIFEWLLYGDKIGTVIADIGSAYEKDKIKFDHTKLPSVLAGIDKLLQTKEGQEQQRAYKEVKTALHELTNQDWKELIEFRERLKAPFVPEKILIQKYVQQLTAHEDYSGDVTILDTKGNVTNIAIGIAPPIDALIFQFERAPGTNKIKLHGLDLQLCNTAFSVTRGDEALAKEVISAAVDIMLASERAATPETKQTRRHKTKDKKRPEKLEKEGKELSKEEQQKIIDYVVEGPGIWYGDKDYALHDNGKVVSRFDRAEDAQQGMVAFLKAHADEHYYYVVNPRQETATAYTRQGDEVLTFPFRLQKA